MRLLFYAAGRVNDTVTSLISYIQFPFTSPHRINPPMISSTGGVALVPHNGVFHAADYFILCNLVCGRRVNCFIQCNLVCGRRQFSSPATHRISLDEAIQRALAGKASVRPRSKHRFKAEKYSLFYFMHKGRARRFFYCNSGRVITNYG